MRVMSLALMVIARAVTVKVAAVVVAVRVPPQVFVNIARYWDPLCDMPGSVTVRVVLVAPVILPQVPPLFVLICHWTVGAGFPLAAALKVASLPYKIVWLDGLLVIDGAVQLGTLITNAPF